MPAQVPRAQHALVTAAAAAAAGVPSDAVDDGDGFLLDPSVECRCETDIFKEVRAHGQETTDRHQRMGESTQAGKQELQAWLACQLPACLSALL